MSRLRWTWEGLLALCDGLRYRVALRAKRGW